jgi:hypothetical protein
MISEACITSIIRVLGSVFQLLVTANVVTSTLILSTLMMINPSQLIMCLHTFLTKDGKRSTACNVVLCPECKNTDRAKELSTSNG